MNKNIQNALTLHLFESDKSTDRVRNSIENQMDKEAFNSFSQFIYKESKKNNIQNILEIEDSILKNALNRASDKREVSTLNAGIDRIDLATQSLANIKSYRSFEKHLNSTPYKDIDSRGLPKDAFRKEVISQITSLQNNARDNKAQHLRDFIDARTYSLKNAENLYKSVQHKHMLRFCKDHPEHPHSKNYLSKPLNQKLITKNQEQVSDKKTLLER